MNTASLFRQSVTIPFRINFLMLGFAYLINAHISLSLWFFYLVYKFQSGAFNILGFRSTEALGPWSHAITGHQMMGAMFALVVSGLWVGRSHLKEVWHKALHPRASIDDTREIMSYRGAVLGTCLGVSTLVLWLWKSGMPAWIALVFVFVALVLLVGLARVVAEAGLPTLVPTMVPAGFVVSGIGVPALGVEGMIATAYTLTWVAEFLIFMTAPLANGLRLSSETSGNRRRLCWAIAAAMGITLVVSAWYTLHLAYHYGGVNLHSQFFHSFASYPSRFAARKLMNPTGPSLSGWLWILSGAAVMILLLLARHHFIWWPFHPIGFVVSMGWVMNHMWFSIFLAWLIKGVILKYGGASLYQKLKPFFLGLILGQFVTGGMWLLIDHFTGMTGNVIPVLY